MSFTYWAHIYILYIYHRYMWQWLWWLLWCFSVLQRWYLLFLTVCPFWRVLLSKRRTLEAAEKQREHLDWTLFLYKEHKLIKDGLKSTKTTTKQKDFMSAVAYFRPKQKASYNHTSHLEIGFFLSFSGKMVKSSMLKQWKYSDGFS